MNMTEAELIYWAGYYEIKIEEEKKHCNDKNAIQGNIEKRLFDLWHRQM